MTDKEKVIKALACCVFPVSKGFPYQSHIVDGRCEVDECPYQGDCDQMLLDALKLLKEQEPVTWSYEYHCFICSNCGLGIEDEVYYMMNKPLNFCPTCGRKVKWDE